jgi:cell division protein FtsW
MLNRKDEQVRRTIRGLAGNFEGADLGLVGSVAVLLFLGTFVVYGAGSYDGLASSSVLGQHYVGIKHLVMIGLGLVGMFTLANINYHTYRSRWLAWGGVAAGMVLMIMTLFGDDSIPRWLTIGGFRFQPVELMKLAMIIFLAERMAALVAARRLGWKDLLLLLFSAPFPLMVVLALQPNFGNVMTMLGVIMAVFFVAEVPWRKLVLMVSVPLGLAFLAFLTVSRLSVRLGHWWNGVRDGEYSYQVYQSLVGLGAGGWFGLGLGNSHNKYSFLPEAHTDFIFSVLGEELGVVGTILVIALLMTFVWCGLGIARRAADPFGRFLATGLTVSLAVYGVANMAMVTGIFPVVGVPLPFVSFGGTAMVSALASVGILLNIDRGSRSFNVWKKRWDRSQS